MNEERLLKIIMSPHVSEKSTIATEKRSQYVFHVVNDANKIEIKQAVEFLFNTKVKMVRTSIVKTKPRRFGKIEGRSKSWKKAYVSLAEGQEINFAGGQ